MSNRYCETSIYLAQEANLAFRFWHDPTHLRLGRAFDLDGEITVAQSHLVVLRAHLIVLRACGWGEGSIEFELLHRDTLRQALCNVVGGSFPADQLCFARVDLEASLGEAIRRGAPDGASIRVMKSLLDHALVATVTIVILVLLLRWSWALLRPLLPSSAPP